VSPPKVVPQSTDREPVKKPPSWSGNHGEGANGEREGIEKSVKKIRLPSTRWGKKKWGTEKLGDGPSKLQVRARAKPFPEKKRGGGRLFWEGHGQGGQTRGNSN